MTQCHLFEMDPPVDLEMESVDRTRNRDRVWQLTRAQMADGRYAVIVRWGRRGALHAPQFHCFTTIQERANFEDEAITRRIAHGYVTVYSRLEEWPITATPGHGAHARG
jgi:predicted DNA-binding WGR domain protein